eukprot:TRINITY_DN798_c0_g1_i2.p1 TRINITY_DN798_c0_g1~~TRINITY_DN798_c0_g1_i2.p1  ORF type:complete len:1311 (-),score=269.74 TRINITY_DN798_c0_g1_i2:1305-5237(-)
MSSIRVKKHSNNKIMNEPIKKTSIPRRRSILSPTRNKQLFQTRRYSDSDTLDTTHAIPRTSSLTAPPQLPHANFPISQSAQVTPIYGLNSVINLLHATKVISTNTTQGKEKDTFVLNGKTYKLCLELGDLCKECVRASKRCLSDVTIDVCSFASKRKSCTVVSPVSIVDIKPSPTINPLFSDFGSCDLLDQPPEIPSEPERQLHLAFLFAGPLVTAYKDEEQTRLKSMPILEYRKEIEEIVSNAGNYHQGIKYKKCVATLDNFQQCMNEMPVALHFAGHGMKNTAFGTDRVCDGDFLVFEDENGKAQYVSCQVLKKILRTCSRQPEFVFVSSCHSRLVGDVFKSAGARHVICVKRSEKVMDEVAILFAQEFYKAFFSPNGTVCTAFEVARTKVMTKTAEHIDHSPYLSKGDEYKKFELLIGGEYLLPHSCSNPYPIPVGEPKNMDELVSYNEIPSKVEHFVGRKTELHNAICLVRCSRIVTIKGLAGIGKSSMAKTLAHFFMERRTFSDGVIFISARGIESTNVLLTQLLISAKCAPCTPKSKTESILVALEDKEILLIIDNAEDTLNKDKFKFLNMIQTLLNKLPKLKILVTSRTHLGSLPDLTEKVYNLLPLDSNSSVLLLERRAPRQISTGEIDELFNERAVSDGVENTHSSFEGHRLMQLLAGHPQAISLAATLLQGRTVKEAYQELLSASLRINEMHPLKSSLSLSIEHIKMRNPASVNFFKMMGLFPCGVSSREMRKIWGSQYKEHIANLQHVSLLVRKESSDMQEDRYWLLPFVADYGLNCLADYNIADVIERGCEFYAGKLEALFMTEVNLHENAVKDESNIMAFIGYGSGRVAREELEEERFELPGLAVSNSQICEPIIESDNKELIPTRDAVEMLSSEESNIAILASHTRNRQISTRRHSSVVRRVAQRRPKRKGSEKLPRTSLTKFAECMERCFLTSDSENEKEIVSINQQSKDNQLSAREKFVGLEDGMTAYGKLVVYYSAVLLLLRRFSDVHRVIRNYVNAPKLASDVFAQANLYKLLGLAADELKDYNREDYYYTAKNLFLQADSYLGQAACLIALGEIEKNRGDYDEAKCSYENALRCYSLIQHEYGVVLCNRELMQLDIGPNHKTIASKYASMLSQDVVADPKKKSKKYIGGVFINRGEDCVNSFIIEVAKVNNGTFTHSSLEFAACSRVISSAHWKYQGRLLHNKYAIYDDIEQNIKKEKISNSEKSSLSKMGIFLKNNKNEELKEPLQTAVNEITTPTKRSKNIHARRQSKQDKRASKIAFKPQLIKSARKRDDQTGNETQIDCVRTNTVIS